VAFEICSFLGLSRFMEPLLLKNPPFQLVARCGQSICRNEAMYLLTSFSLTRRDVKKIKTNKYFQTGVAVSGRIEFNFVENKIRFSVVKNFYRLYFRRIIKKINVTVVVIIIIIILSSHRTK
jgi:hypothetical protein